MKLAENSEVLAEQKMKILYILNKIDKPVNNSNLLKLILNIDDMNYFYFQQFLLDLASNNYIKVIADDENNNENLYLITESGKNSLALVKDMIPGIIRLKIDDSIKKGIETTEEADSITAEFIPISETNFTVTCKIKENYTTIFEIKTFAGSREKAKQIAENWERNAISMYPKLLDILTKPHN